MRALIFDLDGTLWDSTESVTMLWQQELRLAGGKGDLTHAQVMGALGLGPEALANRLAAELPEARRMDVFYRVCSQEPTFIPRHGAKLYPGLVETLQALSKDYALMIASNCIDGYIEGFLGYAGVQDLFCDFLHPGITGLPKADNIRLLMERNGIQKAAMVGDTILDYEAAAGANVPFIYAAYGFGKVPAAEWKIDTFADLPAVAQRIFQA